MGGKAHSTIITHLILIGIIVGAMSSVVTLVNYTTNNLLFNSQQFESFMIENVAFKTGEESVIEITVRNTGSVDMVVDKILVNGDDLSNKMSPNELCLKPKESGAITIPFDWVPAIDHIVIIISKRFNIVSDTYCSPK